MMPDATNPTETYGRGYAWALVWGFTGLSVIFNGAHAVLSVDGVGWVRALSAFMAVIAPVAVLLATHLVIGLIRGWTGRRRWLSALRGFCAATAAAVGGFAFILSFAALSDLAVRLGVPAEQAWMVPAVIDAMIIIATLSVVVAEAEMNLDRADASALDTSILSTESTMDSLPESAGLDIVHGAESTSAESTESIGAELPVSILSSGETDHAEPMDSVVDQAESTESTAGHSRWEAVGTTRGHDPVSTRFDGLHTPESTGSESTESTVDSPPVSSGFTELESIVSAELGHLDATESTAPEPTVSTVDVDQDRPVLRVVSATDGVLAGRVVESLGGDIDADMVAEALRLRATDLSLRRIAEELGVGSHSTVRKWIKTAEDLTSERVTV